MTARAQKTVSVFAVVLAMAGLGWGFSEHQKNAALAFDHRRVALLEQENARLRAAVVAQEKARAFSENVGERARIESAVAKLRQLDFTASVNYDVLTRAGIQRTISQKMREQYSDADFEKISVGLSALGLLPRGYPLKQKYIELLGEQIAAFYDQHQHKLFMFEDALLSNAQNRIVLAHELTHALQDQHFNLLTLPLEIKTNDDRALAASALVEGDATLVMSQYTLQNVSLSGLRDGVAGALAQNMKQLQDAPRYVRESLVFPYLRGQEFCAALFARGGWAAISDAFKNPPSSTAQILHPEKYLTAAREEPVKIAWPKTTVLGEKPLADNVLGEWGARILLAQGVDAKTSETAAQGWRGDRYLVFQNGTALVWKTVWGTANDAREFREALSTALGARDEKQPGAVRTWEVASRAANEVVLIDAADEKWKKALDEQFLDARDFSLRSP